MWKDLVNAVSTELDIVIDYPSAHNKGAIHGLNYKYLVQYIHCFCNANVVTNLCIERRSIITFVELFTITFTWGL